MLRRDWTARFELRRFGTARVVLRRVRASHAHLPAGPALALRSTRGGARRAPLPPAHGRVGGRVRAGAGLGHRQLDTRRAAGGGGAAGLRSGGAPGSCCRWPLRGGGGAAATTRRGRAGEAAVRDGHPLELRRAGDVLLQHHIRPGRCLLRRSLSERRGSAGEREGQRCARAADAPSSSRRAAAGARPPLRAPWRARPPRRAPPPARAARAPPAGSPPPCAAAP